MNVSHGAPRAPKVIALSEYDDAARVASAADGGRGADTVNGAMLDAVQALLDIAGCDASRPAVNSPEKVARRALDRVYTALVLAGQSGERPADA